MPIVVRPAPASAAAALACFGQEAGNGTEKVGVGMVETGRVEGSARRITGQGRGRPRLGRLWQCLDPMGQGNRRGQLHYSATCGGPVDTAGVYCDLLRGLLSRGEGGGGTAGQRHLHHSAASGAVVGDPMPLCKAWSRRGHDAAVAYCAWAALAQTPKPQS
jgi:hypothetical protein